MKTWIALAVDLAAIAASVHIQSSLGLAVAVLAAPLIMLARPCFCPEEFSR